MRKFAGATALIEDVPEIDFDGPHVIFTGGGQRWAYKRETAVKTFARFGEKLREDRLGSEALAKLHVTALGGAKIIKLRPE